MAAVGARGVRTALAPIVQSLALGPVVGESRAGGCEAVDRRGGYAERQALEFYMSRKAILPILLLVAAGAACDGDDELGPDDREDVNGFWVGRTNGLETADDRVFELLLRENDDKKDDDNDNHDDEGTEIDGSGTIKGSNFSIAVLVEGVNVFPDVALTLISEDFSDGKQFINFRGEFVSEDVIRGKLNGGGFNDEPLRLRRTEAFVDP